MRSPRRGARPQLRERTGADAEGARDLVAHGMLVDVLLAVDAPGDLEDAGLRELAACTSGKGVAVLARTPRPAS